MIFETISLLLVQYGLAGLFSASFILSLIFFPGLVEAVIPVFLALKFDPLLVFLFATAGSVAGGFVNYLLGFFGSRVIKKNYSKKMKHAEKWLNKWGPFSVFVTSFVPGFPFDIVAIAVGIFRMNFRYFMISMVLGKALKSAVFVFGFEAFISLASYLGFF